MSKEALMGSSLNSGPVRSFSRVLIVLAATLTGSLAIMTGDLGGIGISANDEDRVGKWGEDDAALWRMIGHDPSDSRSQPLEHVISPASVHRLAPKWIADVAGDIS